MPQYPLARWSVGPASMGASVHTQKVSGNGGGGYYLYEWKRGAESVTLRELVQSVSKEERQWPIGKQSVYADTASVPVPASVLTLDREDQEIAVARLIYADMQERFGEIAEWITYDIGGNPVWFHKEVTGN